ncbi:MAG: [FeFe] hydrogenase H-cluster maturation GTPase HydF [Lachnospiraceae bacterium]|nr:[FeFe] hydrogenase H-cluster maturation GTPase HydF [Lachnospiraceae bacterium]
MTTLNDTPKGSRIHIGFYGKRNSGKSSLINAVTGQQAAIVSDVPGTTTDPVYQAMELHGIGPCVFIDTAGVDDEGELGQMRVEKTKIAAEKTDIAVILFDGEDWNSELEWFRYFQDRKTPVLCVLSKTDTMDSATAQSRAEQLQKSTGTEPLMISAGDPACVSAFREALMRLVPEEYDAQSLTGHLVSEGDLVLLVMPQDIQAPKGRLILPQVQTIRDLLDHKCLVMSCTTDKLDETFAALSVLPRLIVTDSQVFSQVYAKKPAESMLTSFSVLLAEYKGDLTFYKESARIIDALTEESRVLIAECCTHAPLSEDIGREKLPRMLRKRIGAGLTVDIVSGTDFPQDLRGYDLIIQCGACMFNRKYVMTRIDRAREQGVPMSNYGVVIAYLSGILDYITA